ncbi:MAG: acyl carrier protein [Candidatus Omnitrophota bacterium]
MALRSVEEVLKTLIRETGIILSLESSQISPDEPLHLLGFNSMSLVELFVVIEKNFDLKLMESGIGPKDVKTLGSLARRISAMG